jgi:ubiquinone biosynthesis protein UbiJ
MASIQEINRALANKITAEWRQNPQSYPGKYVGLANGQVVVVTDDLDELDDKLDQIEPDASRTFIVEPGLDAMRTEVIWRSL